MFIKYAKLCYFTDMTLHFAKYTLNYGYFVKEKQKVSVRKVEVETHCLVGNIICIYMYTRFVSC